MSFQWNFAGRGGHGHGGPFGRHGFRGPFGGGPRGFRAARMLAAGDLQLIVLALLKEKPRHGYEIIKALEERSQGLYIPSPGVVYPALTYLEEVGFAAVEAEGNKKLYKITSEGQAHLEKNQSLVDDMLAQLSRFGEKMARMRRFMDDEEAENDLGPAEGGGRERGESRQMRAEFMDLRENLKTALREKRHAPLEEQKRVLEVLRRALREIRGK